MSSALGRPCFASPMSPLFPTTGQKHLESASSPPCMTLSRFARRDFLKFVPFFVTFCPTESKGEGASPQDQNERRQELQKPEIDPSSSEPEITDRAYLDISINNQPSHRLILALYGTIAPRTVANFLALCENGYANTKVYRIVPGLTVQLGDVLNNNGKSGRAATESGWLDAETFRITHSVPGIVSMVTKNGRVDSRFFVATRKGDSKYLDGKYVAFGRVVDGMEFLDQIERQGEGWVRKPVIVVASGIMR